MKSLPLLLALALLGACTAPAAAPAAPARSADAGAGAAPVPAASVGAAPAATARPVVPVSIALASITMPFLPFYVAQQKGFDAANGVRFEIPVITGRVAVQSMLAGSPEFSASAGTVLNARLSGAPAVVLLISIDRSTYLLYARPEIRTVADLRGKTVALDSIGSSLHTELGIAFQKLGVNLADVTLVGMPADARPAALESGAADAVVIAPPQNIQLERMGKGFHLLAALGDYAVGINGGLGTATALIQSRPELVDDVVTASLMGLRYIKENREGTIPLLAAFLDLDPDTAAQVYDSTVSAYSDGASTPETRAEIAAHAAEVSPATEPVAVSDLFDLGPLERAVARLQARGWRPE